jgi:hypothetical protein
LFPLKLTQTITTSRVSPRLTHSQNMKIQSSRTSLVWFWLIRRTYPWITLFIIGCKIIYSVGIQQDREKVRFMLAMTKIDFVRVYQFLNDLLW